MSARWKRNTVVAAMAVLVCAAVALNWKYTGQQAAEDVAKITDIAMTETGYPASGIKIMAAN